MLRSMRSTGAASGGHVLRAVTASKIERCIRPIIVGLPERRLLLVGTACHRATRRGCRHRSPPRQRQPEKVTVARLETLTGP